MGQGTLGEVRDGSEDLQGGTGWVRGPLWKSRMGWGTILEVRDGSGDPW